MANRPSRFVAIPDIPQGLTTWQFTTLNAMKENLELLMGVRGSDGSNRAIASGQITVAGVPAQTMSRVTAGGAGFTISNVTVPSLDDYAKLILDVQQLANDVANVRATLNALIGQLRG